MAGAGRTVPPSMRPARTCPTRSAHALRCCRTAPRGAGHAKRPLRAHRHLPDMLRRPSGRGRRTVAQILCGSHQPGKRPERECAGRPPRRCRRAGVRFGSGRVHRDALFKVRRGNRQDHSAWQEAELGAVFLDQIRMTDRGPIFSFSLLWYRLAVTPVVAVAGALGMIAWSRPVRAVRRLGKKRACPSGTFWALPQSCARAHATAHHGHVDRGQCLGLPLNPAGIIGVSSH